MNKCFFIGNLTKDPELRSTPNGVPVGSFTIAVGRDFSNANGEKETDFFKVNVWRGLAEHCGKYLKKGNKVAVFGSLQNTSFTDKDGIERRSNEIVAQEVKFLTPKDDKTEEKTEEKTDDNVLPF